MTEPPRRTIKDLLAEAKDTSELMVDLAYAAVFFDEPKLAAEVDHLEELMGTYIRDLRITSMLAARSQEDAEAFTPILHIASCIEKIADAAVDIARVVSDVLGIPNALRADLLHADEIVGRLRVRSGAPAAGRSLRDLQLPTETGMWVIAIRRGDTWEYDPVADSVAGADDVLLVRGPEEGLALLRPLTGETAPEDVAGDVVVWNELDRAVDILIAMKNTAEVTVGLAYSALMLQERALAAEVATLESRSDELQSELEGWVLRATEDAPSPEQLRGLLRLSAASEAICDSARDMTRMVEQGDEVHPVVAEAIQASDAVATDAVVEAGAPADGRSLRDIRFTTETGLAALAVQRGGRWIYRPQRSFVLNAADRLIVSGAEEGLAELEELVRARVPTS